MSDHSNILFNFIDGGNLNGFSVFDIWKSLGNEGDAQDFLDSMKSPSNIQNLSDLNNDIGFITNAVSDLINYYTKTESYNKEEVNELVSSIPKFNISVVEELPTEGMSATTVYLLKADEEGNNLYTEYIYVNSKWEILGSQKIDLSNYLTKDGDSAENTTTFISNDSTEVTSYSDVETLTTGEKHSSIFNKISTMFKNVRYLYKMLGTTDISSIGGGTVTGAISNLNTNKVSNTDSRLSDARTPKSHNHNDLYYTETEINTKLSNINNTVSTNTNSIAKINSDLDNMIWSQVLTASGQSEENYPENRRLANLDSTSFSFEKNKNHTYLVIMTAKTGSSEYTFNSLSVVNFSNTGADVCVLSHTEQYPFPALTNELKLITWFEPTSFSMNCTVNIIKLK